MEQNDSQSVFTQNQSAALFFAEAKGKVNVKPITRKSDGTKFWRVARGDKEALVSSYLTEQLGDATEQQVKDFIKDESNHCRVAHHEEADAWIIFQDANPGVDMDW